MPRLTKTIKNIKEVKTVSGEGYCRICMKMHPISYFYECTNPNIDKNGYLSICRDHCNEIFDNYFSIHNNIDIALKLTCRDLDVRYSEEALKQAQSHVESLMSKGKKADKLFGYYKSKLGSTSKNNEKLESFRFKDSEFENIINDQVEEEIDDDLVLFWGRGFSLDDYIFLELELSNWKQTHKCDNQAEITLLKEICVKILIIRNKRADKEGVSQDVKELQELFKTASVDPAKANQASAGKSHEAFGLWVKDIEQFRPAEWYEQQDKYKDIDGFKPYLKNYISRPIENFLTGVRNFFVDDNIDADLDSVDVGKIDGDFNGS